MRAEGPTEGIVPGAGAGGSTVTRLGGPADGTLKNGSLFSGKAGSAVPTTPEALSEAPSAPPSGVQLRSPHPSVWSESKFTLIAIIHTVPHQLESRRPLGGPNWEEGREERKGN